MEKAGRTLAALVGLLAGLNALAVAQLDYNFYRSRCPDLDRIVFDAVRSAVQNDTRMAASLLRLHFHDCFVNGCDGSILLDDTDGITGEKKAFPNRNSARGFEVIDDIKSAVEASCNATTVSCADILTIAARDSVFLSGGPYWFVLLGRRDGTTANQSAANTNIPSPFDSLDTIISKFQAVGLSTQDVVVLSGAHTIGRAHCNTFSARLSKFNGTDKPDPTIEPSLLENLQSLCPGDAASDVVAPLDPVTKDRFDNVYFRNLQNNSGVLQSDQALFSTPNASTAPFVNLYSAYPYAFFRDFRISMIKMANIGVLTGSQGEIRNNCRFVNS